MKAVLFGATGMIGQGVLRECLNDPGVERILAVMRRPTELRHEKLAQIVHADFLDFSAIEGALTGYDACFFCLGGLVGWNEREGLPARHVRRHPCGRADARREKSGDDVPLEMRRGAR
jgi:uncharacterized protein YbjT (DUF2867 family)